MAAHPVFWGAGLLSAFSYRAVLGRRGAADELRGKILVVGVTAAGLMSPC